MANLFSDFLRFSIWGFLYNSDIEVIKHMRYMYFFTVVISQLLLGKMLVQ